MSSSLSTFGVFARTGAIALTAFSLSVFATTARAQQSPQESIRTVALPSVVPDSYDGDVRDLPQDAAIQTFLGREFEGPRSTKQALPGEISEQPDPNIPQAAMPAPIQNFAGLSLNTPVTGGQGGAGFPPDVTGDVGPNHYIEGVNNSYAIYSKTGSLLAAFTENSLWSGSGAGTACAANNQGDPVVLHDGLADRWILTNFAFAVSGGNPVAPFYQCIAVSKTSNPVTGGWWLYAVRMDPGTAGAPPVGALNDYPRLGLWTDCLYMATNEFQAPSFNYIGSAFASFSRSNLFAGQPLTSSIGFIPGNNVFTMLPSNLQGTAPAHLPPPGTPNYFVSESQSVFGFEVRKFTAGPNCGSGGTLGPATNVSQASYTVPSGAVATQPNTSTLLDSLGDRLMQGAEYRRIGNTESIWVTHGTRAAGGTLRPQWAQINVTGGTVSSTPLQQQIYAPDTTVHRWMSSLAVDRQGNMALGYSTSNGANFPSIAYSGRLVGDTLNMLPQTQTQVIAGSGSQIFNCGGAPCERWGDYTSMSIDPVDDCTFWYINQYYSSQSNGNSGNWQTRIASFKFPSCSAAPQDQTITFADPGAQTFAPGGTFALSATASSGLPVSFSSATTSICTVASSTATIVAAGTCTINANQAGNASFNPAPQVSRNITISKANQTINFTNPGTQTYAPGGSFALNATASSGLTVSFSSTTSAVCTISGSSANILAAGTCRLRADQAGNSNYNPAPQVLQIITINKASQTITFPTIPNRSIDSGPFALSASASSGLPIIFQAVTPAICTVANGTLTPVAVGTCTVRAGQLGDDNYFPAAEVDRSFSITQATTSSALRADSNVVNQGQTVTLTATVIGFAPSGTVNFRDGAVSISGCAAQSLTGSGNSRSANCATSTLSPGNRSLTAQYSGNTNNAGSTSPVLQVVVNARPTIGAPANASTLEDQASQSIAITLNDAETATSALSLSATSSNQAIVTNPSLAAGLSGSAGNRALMVTPLANAFGNLTITLTVTDSGGATANAQIAFSVNAVNDPPSATFGANIFHNAGSSGAQSLAGFASAISAGPANESGQVVSFAVTEVLDPDSVLSAASVAGNGTLSYNLSGNSGSAVLSILTSDDGGNSNGGINQAPAVERRIMVGSGVDLGVSLVRTAPIGPLFGAPLASYAIGVRNHGAQPVSGVALSVPAPLGLLNVLWDCSVPVGSCVPVNGSDLVNTSFNLAVGASALVELSGDIDAAQSLVEVQATATLPGGVTVFNPQDDQAVLSELSGADELFADGFE